MAEGAVSAAEDKTDTTAKTDTQDKKGSNAVETENMAVEHGDTVAHTDRCLRRRRRRRLRRLRLRRLRRRRLRLLVNVRDLKELVAFFQRLLAERFDRERVGMLRAVKKV